MTTGAAAETASETAKEEKKPVIEVFDMKDNAKTSPLLVALFCKSKAKTLQNGFVNLHINDASLKKLYPNMTSEALKFRLFGESSI